MEQDYTSKMTTGITYRFSHNNLHIRLENDFDQPQANAVIDLLRCNHNKCKRIFIDVRRIVQAHPLAINALKSLLLHNGPYPEQVHFKGKNGFGMAVSGNRVLLLPEQPPHNKTAHEPHEKHVCRGNCARCRCGRHKHAH